MDVAPTDDVTSATAVASSSSPSNERTIDELLVWLPLELSADDLTNMFSDYAEQIYPDKKYLGTLAMLPADVLDNILARLPYKMLFQLKCLATGWQFTVVSRIKKKTQNMVLLPSFPLYSINISNNSLVPQLAIRESNRHIVIGTLVNTLLMVDGCSCTPFIYFPSTKSKLNIPRRPQPSNNEIEESLLFDCNTYGFGHGKRVRDAKIIVISRWRGHREMYSQFYSILNKDWNPISFKERPITILSLAGTLVPLTQSLYWIAQNDELNIYMVLCLDLKSMVFEEILLGAGVPVDDTLGTLGGTLSTLVFVESDSERESSEESIEKKQGFYEVRSLDIHSSWVTIHRTSSLFDEERFCEFYVLCLLDHGGILIKAVNKETNAPTILVYDILQRSCVEVTTPTNQPTYRKYKSIRIRGRYSCFIATSVARSDPQDVSQGLFSFGMNICVEKREAANFKQCFRTGRSYLCGEEREANFKQCFRRSDRLFDFEKFRMVDPDGDGG